eukprot:m.95127 g.95127  ORF g.95127 m.95127 type:complete len:445 (-) comp12319_c0_seq1:185-1519(-)
MSWGRTGVVAGVACLVACTVGYSGVQVILPQSSGKAAHTSAGGYGGGILDAVTGKLSREGSVMVPRTTCSPGWVLGGGGTKGQTSTNFFGNGTWFLLAQEMCGERINQTALFGMMSFYPLGENDFAALREKESVMRWTGGKLLPETRHEPTSVYSYGDFTKYSSNTLLDWNIAWDWSCNIVVVGPSKEGPNFVLQVSEYDAEVRPQPSLLDGKVGSDCANCWRKVPGFSALQPRPAPPGPSRTGEWSCGDTCVLHTLVEYVDESKTPVPGLRRLIGTTYRTGKLSSNISDSVNLQTLTYSSPYIDYMRLQKLGSVEPSLSSFFLGLGLCCTAPHCAPECAGHDGALVLVSYAGLDSPIQVLAVLPAHAGETDVVNAAVSLGVVADPGVPWGPTNLPVAARVFVNKKILTYEITEHHEGKLAARLNSTSPEIAATPVAWSMARQM